MYDISQINHSPHPFTIGAKHVKHASKYHGGIIGDATFDTVPCAVPCCTLSRYDHKYDTVLALQLVRNIEKAESDPVLKKITPILERESIDGIVFVETEEKFRVT